MARDKNPLLQPGDSVSLKNALDYWEMDHAMGGSGTARMRTITKRFGAIIAQQVRDRVGQAATRTAPSKPPPIIGALMKTDPGAVRPSAPTPSPGVTQLQASIAASAAAQPGGLPQYGQWSVPGNITAEDLLGLPNLSAITDLGTAQQMLDDGKNNPQFMAQLKIMVSEGRKQQYLAFAGLAPNLADQTVTMSPLPDYGAIAGPAAAAGLPMPSDLQMSFADALTAPKFWSAAQIEALQNDLAVAFPSFAGTYHPTIYDPATTKMYATLLQQAQEMNQPVSDVMNQLKSNPVQAPVAPETRADPLQVEDFVRNTFQKYAGRLPTADEMTSYVTDYRSFEDRAYQSGLAQARATTQGVGQAAFTTYNPQTNIQADIQAEIAQSQPAQVYGFQPYGAAIDKILGK